MMPNGWKKGLILGEISQYCMSKNVVRSHDLAGDLFAGMKLKGCGFSYELLENLPHLYLEVYV
jgi:hypothetical protein